MYNFSLVGCRLYETVLFIDKVVSLVFIKFSVFSVQVRDYCLGPTFPTLKNVTLMNGASEEPGKVPEVK